MFNSWRVTAHTWHLMSVGMLAIGACNVFGIERVQFDDAPESTVLTGGGGAPSGSGGIPSGTGGFSSGQGGMNDGGSTGGTTSSGPDGPPVDCTKELKSADAFLSGSSCYLLSKVDETMKWSDAEGKCKKIDPKAHLAIVSDLGEWDTVVAKLNLGTSAENDRFWLGGRRKDFDKTKVIEWIAMKPWLLNNNCDGTLSGCAWAILTVTPPGFNSNPEYRQQPQEDGACIRYRSECQYTLVSVGDLNGYAWTTPGLDDWNCDESIRYLCELELASQPPGSGAQP